MRKTTTFALLISFFILLLVTIFVTGKSYKKTQLPKENSNKQKEEKNITTTQRILSSSITTECKVKVKTAEKVFEIPTKISELQSKNCNNILHKISPSQKYLVFTDISGKTDKEFKIYSGKLDKVLNLYTLGPTDILSLEFLPKDYLAVLTGYINIFGSKQEPKLAIIDINGIFKQKPLSTKENRIVDFDKYKKVINITTTKDTKIIKLNIKNGNILIYGKKKDFNKVSVVKTIPFKTVLSGDD